MIANSIVLSTSLFGQDIKHRGGALQCVEELQYLRERLGPIHLAVYWDQSVPESTLSGLASCEDVSLVEVVSDWAGVGTLGSVYRYLGFYDYRDAQMILTWDLDNSQTSGLFEALLTVGRQHDATFCFMRKRNPPRKRLFNADCWSAFPSRDAGYEQLALEVIASLVRYFNQSQDVLYGCDERALNILVREFLLRPRGDSRLLKIIMEQFTCDGVEVDYDAAQRRVMTEMEFLELEQSLGSAASLAPRRDLQLAGFGFPLAASIEGGL